MESSGPDYESNNFSPSPSTSSGRESQNDRAWLDSEPQWRVRLGENWHGTRILGSDTPSAEGFTSLFTYIPPADSPIQPDALTQLVVKQVCSKGEEPPSHTFASQGTRAEVEAYTLLNTVGSKYVTRMYRCMHRDIALGLAYRPADDDGCVDRLFLEFCPGGDMEGFLKGLKGRPLLEEEDCWWIFRCLSLGCSVLERGTEDSSAKEWDHEVVHLDLKPANVFLGTFDEENDRLPIFKFGDFGTAEDISKIPEEWQENGGDAAQKLAIRNYLVRGSVLQPPEMLSFNNSNLSLTHPVRITRIGAPANIWQVGVLMYLVLMCKSGLSASSPPCSLTEGPCPLSEKLRAVPHFQGSELALEGHEITNTYSAELRTLILECLLREPDQRPCTAELQTRVQAGYDKWKDTAARSVDHPCLANIPRTPLGTVPPAEWAAIDADFISVLFSIRTVASPAPANVSYLRIPYIHRVATIGQLNLELARRLRKDFSSSPIDIFAKFVRLRWKSADSNPSLPGRYLADHERLVDIDVQSHDILNLFVDLNLNELQKWDTIATMCDNFVGQAQRRLRERVTGVEEQ